MMQQTVTNKHAYLIMAHNNFDQLQILLELLDDDRNDIYLHIDKKASDFHSDMVKTEKAGLVLVKRIRVAWGGHSMIECEMNLLQAASKHHYCCYHLISGVDLPLKTQDEIHAFIAQNPGKNYVGVLEDQSIEKKTIRRIQYYHFLQDYVGREKGLRTAVLKRIERITLRIQESLHVCRRVYFPIYKSPNWFSITDDMVQFILSQKKLIKKQFYFGRCADELFLPSVAMASPYYNTIVRRSMRKTDWTRGKPYTFRKEDVPDLLASDALFARKFNMQIDKDAVEEIAAYIKEKQQRK